MLKIMFMSPGKTLYRSFICDRNCTANNRKKIAIIYGEINVLHWKKICRKPLQSSLTSEVTSLAQIENTVFNFM